MFCYSKIISSQQMVVLGWAELFWELLVVYCNTVGQRSTYCPLQEYTPRSLTCSLSASQERRIEENRGEERTGEERRGDEGSQGAHSGRPDMV